MTTNVGPIDRVARAVLGLVLLGLPFAAGLGAVLANADEAQAAAAARG